MSWRPGASRGRRTTRRRRRSRGRPVIRSCLPPEIASHSERAYDFKYFGLCGEDDTDGSCLEIALRVAGGPRGQIVDQPHLERVLPPVEAGQRPVGFLRAKNPPSEICNSKQQVVRRSSFAISPYLLSKHVGVNYTQ